VRAWTASCIRSDLAFRVTQSRGPEGGLSQPASNWQVVNGTRHFMGRPHGPSSWAALMVGMQGRHARTSQTSFARLVRFPRRLASSPAGFPPNTGHSPENQDVGRRLATGDWRLATGSASLGGMLPLAGFIPFAPVFPH
jgi:hypothetical protein